MSRAAKALRIRRARGPHVLAKREIRILGAGVSGLATAVLLAQRGCKVIVHDRRSEPGGRFAGGFQVLENSSSREDVRREMTRRRIPIDCDLVPLHSAIFIDDRQRTRSTVASVPFGYLVRRGGGGRTLDVGLLQAASHAGVDLDFSSSIRESDVDVVASGPSRADGVARELTFTTSAPDAFYVMFARATRSGYAYLFIREGFGTMGVALVREMSRLKEASSVAFERLRDYVDGTFSVVQEQTHFMSFFVPTHLYQNGRWRVGEAAGVQDYIFGLGNRLAFRTAAFAADAIVDDSWDKKAFYREVQRPMAVSVLGRRIFEAADRCVPSALFAFLTSGDLRERLLLAQRPDPLKVLLAKIVTKRFNAASCVHGDACLWCPDPRMRITQRTR